MNPDKPTFEEHLTVYRDNKEPLYKREVNLEQLSTLIELKRRT